METTLPISHQVKQPSEIKKVLCGFAYHFALEIIFFLSAAISIMVVWYLVFHCAGINDHQQYYCYHPYEIKYFTIVIGGVKRRVAVKKFYQHRILGQ